MTLRHLLILFLAPIASAQLPFYTDDADTTEHGFFHIEISNQQAWLQRSALPATSQNTSVFQLAYGLGDNLEVSVDVPLIFLSQQNVPLTYGQGDVNFSMKWRIQGEQSNSRRPASTITCAIETPTGSTRKQLGSGIPDYGCNYVLQKQLGLWTLHVNNGALFSGNAQTGVVGLRAKGLVYIGSGSITHSVHPRLLLGVEANGSSARQGGALGKNLLQTQAGGIFEIKHNFTFNFAAGAGWFSGAPRATMLLGIAADF